MNQFKESIEALKRELKNSEGEKRNVDIIINDDNTVSIKFRFKVLDKNASKDDIINLRNHIVSVANTAAESIKGNNTVSVESACGCRFCIVLTVDNSLKAEEIGTLIELIIISMRLQYLQDILFPDESSSNLNFKLIPADSADFKVVK